MAAYVCVCVCVCVCMIDITQLQQPRARINYSKLKLHTVHILSDMMTCAVFSGVARAIELVGPQLRMCEVLTTPTN